MILTESDFRQVQQRLNEIKELCQRFGFDFAVHDVNFSRFPYFEDPECVCFIGYPRRGRLCHCGFRSAKDASLIFSSLPLGGLLPLERMRVTAFLSLIHSIVYKPRPQEEN